MLKSLLSIFRFGRHRSEVAILRHKMERVFVRSVEGEERIQISLLYRTKGKQTTKEVNADRCKTEELSKTLERLGANLTKRTVSKKKFQSLPSSNLASMSLKSPNSELVQENIPNNEAWSTGSILEIQLHDNLSEYKVVLNPPKLKFLKLPDCFLAGFSVYPELDGEFIDLDMCVFKWYRITETPKEGSDDDECEMTGKEKKTKKRRTSGVYKKEEAVGEEPFYVIQNSDIGSKLKLVCIPKNKESTGQEVEVISKSRVTTGPETTPFEKRHLLTEACTADESVRVMSYNILADIYADSDFSRDMLFPYCPADALSMDYRQHLLVKEILGYNSDIVCLQEVDTKVFRRHLLPALRGQGYEGVLKVKAGEVREGTATFIRAAKFRIVQQHDISLRDELRDNKLYEELWKKISENENMKEKMEARTTILQVTVLECINQPNKYIIVGNTHLYFHPYANNTRLLQTFVCLQHLHHIWSTYQEQGKDGTVMFCGDFNSMPLSGAVELVTQGSVPSKHADWYSGGKPLLLENMDLQHKLKFSSACGFPQYTNYKSGFNGCLDYIFVEPSKLSVERVIPLQSHQEVTQFTAIPNPVFPSDHLALVCDLKWVQRTE